MSIFERIKKSSGGPLGQYREKAEGYFVFPKLEGELGPHMASLDLLFSHNSLWRFSASLFHFKMLVIMLDPPE